MRLLILVMLCISLPVFMLSSETVQDFSLPDINNNNVSFSDHLGEGLIILDFWASWCAPCMRLLPELDKIHSDYDNVTVITISIDNPRSVNRAKSLIRSQRYSFITLFDTNHEIMKRFQVTTVPHTFLISPSGAVLYEHTGYTRGDEESLKAEIEKHLTGLSKESGSDPSEK